MVPSALYRYFPSRDALLTALIVDAFDAVGSAAENADRAGPEVADLADTPAPPESVTRDLSVAVPDLSPVLVALGMSIWAQLIGSICLKLFGHLETVVFDRDAFFDHQLTLALDRLGYA